MPVRPSPRACRPRVVTQPQLLLALLCASVLATACLDDSLPPQTGVSVGTPPPVATDPTPLPPKLRCAPDAAAIAAASGQIQLASDCATVSGAHS